MRGVGPRLRLASSRFGTYETSQDSDVGKLGNLRRYCHDAGAC